MIIPNIEQPATITDHTITLADEPHYPFEIGDIVNLQDEMNRDIPVSITNVIDNLTYEYEGTHETTLIHNTFIKGKTVNDFHVLDKNAIFTVATAAL